MEIKQITGVGLNIILSLDDAFVDFTKTAMLSVLNTTNKDVNFYLLTNSDSISLKDFDALKKVKDCNIEIAKIPEKLYKYLKKRKIFAHLSEATYFRHFAPLMLPEVKKAIYLDSDVLVLEDLKSLFETPIGSFEYVKGVEDAASEKKMEFWGLDRYINAGVLLMNLDFVRRGSNEFYDKIKFFYETWGDKTISGDQDMLNFLFRPNYLPIKYNLYHPFFNKKFLPKSCPQEEYYKYCQSPAIIHFVGGRKPWIKETVHPYKGLWESTFNLLKNLEV